LLNRNAGFWNVAIGSIQANSLRSSTSASSRGNQSLCFYAGGLVFGC
jgi:hypothetical protein